MQLLEKVEINYFRSLYAAEMGNIGDLNVLFGRNDSGKSNFLRALNLFFNNKIENSDPEFREHFDFRINLSDARKKADKKFVWIKVTFNVPPKYQGTLGQKAIVKKQWNTLGQIPPEVWLVKSNQQIKHSDMTQGQKAQLTRLLNDIDFTYIPAVKDLGSFADLVERMYGAVAQSEQLKKETNDFIAAIGGQAKQLTKQLEDLFDGTASLAPPTQMEKLFRNLDFSLGQNRHSLLKQKGDGIKARHIPELLRFINGAEQRKKLFLWGFEEPENSLDLGAASTEAHRFFDFAMRNDTQVFITSHSPAFYLADASFEGEHQISRFFIRKQQGARPIEVSPQNAVVPISTLEETERAMGEAGLLQLPFIIRQMAEHEREIYEKRAQIAALEDEASLLRHSLENLTTPTLYVEGKHDVVLFSAALDKLGCGGEINVLPLGGTPNNPRALISAVMAQGGLNANANTLFLFDNDKAGRTASKEICGESNGNEPIEITQQAWSWVLPLSEEYEQFLEKWELKAGSAFFPAEFLLPAQQAASLYQHILDDEKFEPKPLVQGDIWKSVMNNQTKSHDMNCLQPGTVDWFFSRGVHDDLKESFANGALQSGLNTDQIDMVTKSVAGILMND